MAQNDQNRLSEGELERKLDELDRKLTPSYLRKRLKLALHRKVEAGDIATLDDIRKLEARTWKRRGGAGKDITCSTVITESIPATWPARSRICSMTGTPTGSALRGRR
jgi:hypothetical protein